MKKFLQSLIDMMGFIYVHITSTVSSVLILSVIIIGEHNLYSHTIGSLLFVTILIHFTLSLLFLSKYKFFNRAWTNGSIVTSIIVMITVLASILGTSPMVLGVVQLSLIGMILLFMIINVIQK